MASIRQWGIYWILKGNIYVFLYIQLCCAGCPHFFSRIASTIVQRSLLLANVAVLSINKIASWSMVSANLRLAM